MTRKWLLEFQSHLKVTPKVTFDLKSHFWVTSRSKSFVFRVTLRVALGETPKVTFESLSSDFQVFGVSGVCRKRAEYCFESTVSEKRTHWVLRQTRWVRRKTRWVRFSTQIKGWENSLSSLPATQWAPKNSLSSVFETVLRETVFGPFPNHYTLNSWKILWGVQTPSLFCLGSFQAISGYFMQF